jgi:hypothetical protein
MMILVWNDNCYWKQASVKTLLNIFAMSKFTSFKNNVHIKFSAHEVFLEEPSSTMLNAKIFENQII